MSQEFLITIVPMSEEEEAEFNRQVETERERCERERAGKNSERARKIAESKRNRRSAEQLGLDF
jgi:hypothetical protein